jgi:hypothetical protein
LQQYGQPKVVDSQLQLCILLSFALRSVHSKVHKCTALAYLLRQEENDEHSDPLDRTSSQM